jgi:CarD family transcriptional regulator
MASEKTAFKVGDKVMHWSYGPGEIVQLDAKDFNGKIVQCYVVKVGDLTLWVPVDDNGEHCIRPLTRPEDFENLFSILASNGEPLSMDIMERKRIVRQRMRSGTLESVCTVVRDLTHHKRIGKMTENDRAFLEQTRNLLLEEWSLVLDVPIENAEQELGRLLQQPEP